MIDYYSKDKRYGIDRSKERLRRAEYQYRARIAEAGLILVTGVLIIIIIGVCVVLFSSPYFIRYFTPH